jgi:hypothetical protein
MLAEYVVSRKESEAIAIPLLLSLIVTLHFQTTQLRACVFNTLAASGHLSIVNMYSVLLVLLTVFAIVHHYCTQPTNVNIVKKFEGFRDTSYTDPIGLAPLAMGICARPRAAQNYSRSYTILDPSIQICSP